MDHFYNLMKAMEPLPHKYSHLYFIYWDLIVSYIYDTHKVLLNFKVNNVKNKPTLILMQK